MSIQKIACCTDFSENAELAFATALDLAEKYHASLTVLHVMPPTVNPMLSDTEWILPEEPRESLADKLKNRLETEYDHRIASHLDRSLVVLDGHVSSEILAYLEAHQIDLVVVGSYGSAGMELVFFGSVAKRVAHKAPCAVLIARQSWRT